MPSTRPSPPPPTLRAPGFGISYLRYRRMTEDYLGRIGNLIRDARKHRGLTQSSSPTSSAPARARSTGSSAGTRTSPWRCWRGSARPSTPRSSRSAPGRPTCGSPAPPRCRADRGQVLQERRVALLCASLLNQGRTTLRKVARIEEVNRILEVLASLGVQTRWLNEENDLEIIPPAEPRPEHIDEAAARRTRSMIMFLGPLLHRATSSSCLTQAGATSAPARSSRTWRRCGPSASRSRRPRAATTRRSTRGRAEPAIDFAACASGTPSASTGSAQVANEGFTSRGGKVVSRATQRKMAYALWNYGRSDKRPQQAAVMLYVHSLIGDARPAMVSPSRARPGSRACSPKIGTRVGAPAGPSTSRPASRGA